MHKNKVLKQKFEKFFTIVVVTLIFMVGIYGFDIVQGGPFNKVFNYKVANYHIIDRCLKFSYIYSNITKNNSKVSWYFRNILMKQYIKIKKSYDSNFYNSIGLFYSISNDFKFLYELNENNKNLTIEEKEQYESYKEQFLSELYTILKGNIMKRREFILNSMLAVGGSALLTSGCGKKEIIKKEGQIAKRKFKDLEIPLLGFGCMRLPMHKNEIDMVELDKMAEYAMAHGANYFDTAYMYVEGKSENAIGKVLKKYDRSSFILADKSPIYKMNSREDVRKIFDEQRKKCQVDYFDFYMCHNINANTVEQYRNVKMVEELAKLKDEGLIKYFGFSFHGTPEILKDVVKDYNWDFAQLQVNYLDWDVVKAHEQYNIVQELGIPVTVMEPLRGGGLVNLSEKAMAKLKENYPNSSPAEFGLRWAASQNNVVTVLSGMSNLTQMKENIATFENFKPMSEEEIKTADEIAKIIQSQGEINCTACKYCMEVCPKGINIPAIFSLYNQYKVTNSAFHLKIYYETLSESERANNCIKCGLCNKNCPQNLPIPDLLAQVQKDYEKASEA